MSLSDLCLLSSLMSGKKVATLGAKIGRLTVESDELPQLLGTS